MVIGRALKFFKLRKEVTWCLTGDIIQLINDDRSCSQSLFFWCMWHSVWWGWTLAQRSPDRGLVGMLNESCLGPFHPLLKFISSDQVAPSHRTTTHSKVCVEQAQWAGHLPVTWIYQPTGSMDRHGRHAACWHLIANISRWSASQTRDCELLHVLWHVLDSQITTKAFWHGVVRAGSQDLLNVCVGRNKAFSDILYILYILHICDISLLQSRPAFKKRHFPSPGPLVSWPPQNQTLASPATSGSSHGQTIKKT